MGGGGFAGPRPGPALSARQQRKLADVFYGDFDLGALPDLATLPPPVDEAFDLANYGLDNDGFDWGDMPAVAAPVPEFGTLSVDVLFAKPAGGAPRGPASPLRATAPGSTAVSPLRPVAPAAPLAASSEDVKPLVVPAVPLVQSTPIQTHYAASKLDTNVVLVRAPKRAAEQPASPRQAAGRSWELQSDVSDDDVAAFEGVLPQEPLHAKHLGSQAEAEAALAEINTQQQTHDGEIVTLSPTMWRSNSPPFRIHVNAGLRTMRAAETEAPATFFGSLHPRIVTTGVPHRCLGRAGGRLVRTEAVLPPETRSRRAHGGAAADRASSVSNDLGVTLRREKAADHPTCSLQEVWLLRRSIQRGQQWTVQAHQCTGPFDGTTLPSAMDWPGAVTIDVVAKVEAPGTGTFWIKACGRVPLSFDAEAS